MLTKPVPTRGWKGWREEAFGLWGLTLVAFCSPGEVLVSTPRIRALPVSSSVLDVSSSGGVPSGTSGPAWGEASSVSSTASHATHGTPRTSWAPWTCNKSKSPLYSTGFSLGKYIMKGIHGNCRCHSPIICPTLLHSPEFKSLRYSFVTSLPSTNTFNGL